VKICECEAVNPDDANFCAACGRHLAEPAPTSVENVASDTPRQLIQPQRALRIAAVFVVAILVIAGGLTFLLRNVHIDIHASQFVSVQLPLNVCKTSVGDASETAAKLPATIHVRIARGEASALAFYSDNEGLIKVLAPTGWKCSAGIGADGSSSLSVSPPSGANSTGSALEAINASQTSACVGCRESLACPLFASAALDYLRTYVQICPTTRPASEHVTKINAHVVEFSDPPHVNGDAIPSGGAYPASGVMTYFAGPRSDGSWTETCVLPRAESSTCKVVIENFKSKYGRL
jgi:hypothetical protein